MHCIEKKLNDIKSKHLFRSLTLTPSLVDFASNDYLGFAKNALLQKHILKKMQEVSSIGSTGSRLLTGNSLYFIETEKIISDFHQSETAVLCSSGYQANLSLFSSLPKDWIILYDEFIHASIRDGLRLRSGCSYKFQHQNLQQLSDLLQKYSIRKIVVAVEGIYSTTGTITNLKRLFELSEKTSCEIVLDEAHSFGFFPKGLASEYVDHENLFARVVTYGKALGISGAAILCSHLFQSYLVNVSRPLIYSTAPSFFYLAAIQEAYAFYKEHQNEVQKLHKLTAYTKNLSPILPFSCPIKEALPISHQLHQAGFDVRALRYPTVKENEAILRMVLHSYNTPQEVDTCLHILKKYAHRLSLQELVQT